MIKSFDHISLAVRNVDASREFYLRIGFVEIERPNFGFPGAWFRIGSSHQLHLIEVNEEIKGGGSRSTHYAFSVEDPSVYRIELESRGIRCGELKERPDGMLQCFFSDPDGHVWECNNAS